MAIIIPKRGYLTFAELLQRWQCTANDLRYLVVNAELKPSIKATQELTIASWGYDVMEGVCVPEGAATDDQSMYTLTVRPAYWLYLQSPKQTSAMSCEFRLATRERDPKTPDDPWEDADTWFWLPWVIGMTDIENEAFFTMDEVLKYEAAHDQDAPPKQEEKPLLTRERNNLLTIIGGMLGLMLGKTPAGKSQSVFEGQEAIIAALLAHHKGTPGISKSGLEGKFAEANRSIKAT